jgi:glycosyltransferase involved in cell wall biosynthesis
MKKILYVDVPFSGMNGNDKKRSQFIWSVLSKNYDADLLLIKSQEYLTKNIPTTIGYSQYYTITPLRNTFMGSKAIHKFSHENKAKFSQILLTKQYEFVFFRLESCFELALLTEEILPQCNIVLDIDNLFSHKAHIAWLQNPDWKHKYKQIEYLRLRQLEKKLFAKPFHFVFANKLQLQSAIKIAGISDESKNFLTIHDALTEPIAETNKYNLKDKEQLLLKDKYILFYGDLATESNLDAFKYLTKEIYPKVYKKLQEKDIKLYIVGKNQQAIHTQLTGGRIKLIGEVENIHAFIKASVFVVLPLRSNDSKVNRIMESALQQKAVLTTSKALEGYDLSPEDVAICDKTEDFCNKLILMASKPESTIDMGQNFSDKILSQYDKTEIENKLLDYLENMEVITTSAVASNKLRIALVTDTFLDDDDYTGYNIYLQAKKLAEQYDVTVFYPRRNHQPAAQVIDNINVIRLYNVISNSQQALCPGLFVSLMKMDFDLIQCYPRLNYNNTIAFVAAKLKEIPIIQCFYNLLDYDKLICEAEHNTPELLSHIQINSYERFIIKNLDYIFAVSEREYAFLRKLNAHTEHIPVPIDTAEFETELPSIREKTGINESTFVFLCLGRIAYIKGQDIVLRAFTKALPSLPNAKLIFIGKTDVEPDYFEDMELFVIREGIQDEVTFTGCIERTETLAWLKEADVHIIPARFMNVGTIVLESWASDTVVLQSDAVDPNLVIEDFNGFLFRSEDIEDLALQMQKAYSNRKRLPELAERGKALVHDNYSFDKLMIRFQKVYKQVIH